MEGREARLRWTHVDGQAPCGRPHGKLKLESTDVILSSSHTNKLVSFIYQNFVFRRNNRNRKLQTSKAPLKSQAQGTSLFTSAASKQRGFPIVRGRLRSGCQRVRECVKSEG